MDIDLLRTFLEVRRLGNFRSAAENLHVTQAAVSQRIKHLESILDAPLFVREKNNIYATHASEQLVPAAESIIETWLQARQEIGLIPQFGSALSIGASAGAWDLYGNSCLSYLHEKWTDMSLKAEILSEDLIIKRLLAQVLDLAFLISSCDAEYLECEIVASFELVLHSASSKTLEQALSEPYFQVEWGRDIATVSSSELGFEQQPRLQFSDHVIARNFLESNVGSAFLPIVEGTSKSGAKTVEGSPRLQRNVFATWHKRNPNQASIEEIVTALQTTSAAVLLCVS